MKPGTLITSAERIISPSCLQNMDAVPQHPVTTVFFRLSSSHCIGYQQLWPPCPSWFLFLLISPIFVNPCLDELSVAWILCLCSFTRVPAGYLGTSHTKDVVILAHKDICAISEKVLPDGSVMHILGVGESRVDSMPKAKLQEKNGKME